MPRPPLVALTLLALAVLAVCALLWWRGGEVAPATRPVQAEANALEDAEGRIATQDPSTPTVRDREVRRVVAEQGAAPGGTTTAHGTLRVLARWPEAVPAEGVMVHLRRSEIGHPATILASGLTDVDGAVTFDALPAAKANLLSDRGDRQVVELSGRAQEVVFELAAGVDVRGTVTDPDGAPLADAVIWLQTSRTDWAGGREVARTDASGHYRIARVGAGMSLGAIAPGFAPSALVDLDEVDCTAPPAIVDLRLEGRGGRLEGTVTDASGQPIAAALVAAGAAPRFLDHRGHRIVEAWTPRVARTDTDGHFAFEGLAPGDLPVAVRKDGCGIWRTATTIEAGRTTTIAPRLSPSAVLYGAVTDGRGRPIAGAEVSVFDQAPGTSFIAGGQIDFDATFGHVATVADATGAYHVDGVTPGTAHVFAQIGGRPRAGVSVAYATETLDVPPGATVEWNPVIADRHAVEGIVLYRDGHPMGDVFITLTDERSGAQHVMTNDAQGVFRFLCLDPSTYSVRVQYWEAPKGTPTLQVAGIAPDRGRVELRAPFDKPVEQEPGTVLGRVDDVAGRITNPAAAFVSLQSDARWFREDGKLQDGAFRFERVEPCRFRLALHEGTTVIAQSDWFELPPAGTVDTGALRTEPGGTLRVVVARDSATEGCEPKLYLRRDGFGRSTVVELGRAREVLVANLTAGAYELTGYAKGMVPLRGQTEVRAGETTEVRLAMRGGALCRFDVWFPEDSRATQRTYRVVARDDTVFHESTERIEGVPTRPYPVVVTVPVGEWTLEFATDDGLAGRTQFTVALPGEEPKGRIELR